METYKRVRLSELISQNTVPEKIADTRNERYITVSLYGMGVKERVIKDDKYPVPFVGYRVSEGQFIYSRIDARNGAYGIIKPELNGFVVSKDFPVYDINTDRVLPQFLLLSVLGEGFLHQVKNSSFGATNRMRIKEEVLEDYSISLPPIEEQTRIAKIIGTAQSILEHRQNQLRTFDSLIKARFVEMFGSPKPSWPTISIGDICTDIRTGPFGSALHHDEFVDDGIFVLGIDNAVENRFSYNRMRYITEEKYQQLKRYTVYPGDVIITIMGTIGRSAVIPADMPLAINTKHLACLTPDYAKVDSVFLCSAFQMHPDVQRQLTGNAKGAIMDGLNLGIIKGLRFHLPPLQEQKNFEQFYAQVDKSKVAVQQALDKAQLLFDSLMQQYFG